MRLYLIPKSSFTLNLNAFAWILNFNMENNNNLQAEKDQYRILDKFLVNNTELEEINASQLIKEQQECNNP